MAKFTKIPETTFKKLQLNAGILLSNFSPETATVEDTNILGATSGGVSFSATPSFSDAGEDIDNAPKNTKELKTLDSWEIKMSGTFVTTDTAVAKRLLAAADVSGNKITPRDGLTGEDFEDLWWVGDYSDETGEADGGFVAIRMMNALSTGGFAIQSSDKGKGTFAFEFTAHYSMVTQTTVPCEIYIKSGSTEGE